MEFTDRYQALGIPYPDTATMCVWHCEGTGWVPVHRGEEDPTLRALWQRGHAVTCSVFGRARNFVHGCVSLNRFRLALAVERCDGYHFVKCPNCNGTGLR